MSNKLSHSAATRFQSCPKEYEFHYIKNLRSTLQSSALLFGSAIDKAFEALTKGEDPYAVFDKVWAFQEINKVVEPLQECEKIVYSDSEFDSDLLTNKHKEKLNEWIKVNLKSNINYEDHYSSIKTKKKTTGFRGLDSLDKRFYNLANWCSLERKGHLMIEALKSKVLPKLTKIIATQKEIQLKNAEGDTITGFADLVAMYGPHENDVVVFDLKTSTLNYEEDAVLTSPQLSLYVHALSEEFKTRKAGFIVLNKRVQKNKAKVCSKCNRDGTSSRARTCDNTINGTRCGSSWVETLNPEIYVQIIVDVIPDQTENIVLDNMDHINQMIKQGIFHRNLSNCVRPWGKCPFFNVCYKEDYSEVMEVK